MNFIKNGMQAIKIARNKQSYKKVLISVYFMNFLTPGISSAARLPEIFLAEKAVNAPDGIEVIISKDSKEFRVP
jgi:hypothetical protein